ncbi:Hypothetical protein GSB_152353 [Giardia duodenalis]|uniref:Uncharacterized protein n=2 Tax=Giardia intestinalis TaxID=5741 RepID=C6LN38_GIAIB|nr:Hypothetical protein GL50581_138 [Giardia intestinalis ATCC 50581]ESU44079.1 Hypothetical protein GSB_152353 [Giardia intestinalis]
MPVAESHESAQDNPAVLTVWTSGFTGHIASASLRNARLATLIETLLKANYNTLQDFSIILSGVVLIQTYKSSTVLSVARKMHQLLSLAKPARRTSSGLTKSVGSRTLGLSLHFSTIAANKVARNNKLISSIFGAQSEIDGPEDQEYPGNLDFAYQLPGGIGASMLREDTESDSFPLSKATNIPYSLTNPESQDLFHDSVMGSTSLANRSEDDMQIRAAEGDVVRDASEIGLNDLDVSRAAAGNTMHSSLLSKHAFDISNSTLLENSRKLTSLLLANTSSKLSDVTVIAKEIKDPAKKRNAAVTIEKKTRPPSFLFDKQARMHHSTMQKYSYKPPNQTETPFYIDFRNRCQVPEVIGASDLTFHWSEPEYHDLTTVLSKNWSPAEKEDLLDDACVVTTPVECERAPESDCGEHPLLNEETPVRENSLPHQQEEIPENCMTLLSMLRQSSTPLLISELARSSRQVAASLFLAALALRATNTVVIKQCCTTSLQHEISISVSSH